MSGRYRLGSSAVRGGISRAWLACGLLLGVIGGGCGEKDCTATVPAPSTVRVVGRDGSPVLDARVARRAPGAADSPIGCTGTAASEGCESRAVYLPVGTSTLVASRADGSSPTEQTVTVVDTGTEDCPNAAPQQITIVLDP